LFIRRKRGGGVLVFTNTSLVICLADCSTLHGSNVHYRQCTYKCNIETVSLKHFCRGKAVSRSIMYSENTSVAVVSQHAMRVRRVILSLIACLALPLFLHYLINGATFSKDIIIIIIIIIRLSWSWATC
jgi:hypothetical protein